MVSGSGLSAWTSHGVSSAPRQWGEAYLSLADARDLRYAD